MMILLMLTISVVGYGQSELDETLANVVARAMEVAEATGEFVVEQSPLLLQEFYMWHTTVAIFWIVIGIAPLLIGLLVFNKAMEFNDGEYWYSPAPLGANLLAIAGFATIATNTYTLLFISIAPKLYLIEYFLH